MVAIGLHTDLQTLPTRLFLTCIPLSLVSKQHTLSKCFPKSLDKQINFYDSSHENVEFWNWKESLWSFNWKLSPINYDAKTYLLGLFLLEEEESLYPIKQMSSQFCGARHVMKIWALRKYLAIFLLLLTTILVCMKNREIFRKQHLMLL